MLQPCGSVGAYQRHKRRGENPCDACRAANAGYHRERRAAGNGVVTRWSKRTRAAALESLARRYRAEYLKELTAARTRDPRPEATS